MRATNLQNRILDLSTVSNSECGGGSLTLPSTPSRTPSALPTILCLILAFVLGLCAATPAAQAQHGQWSDLKALRARQGIDLIESNMKNHHGGFVEVTDEEITLREKGSEVSVKREHVARVSTASNARRGEHAVVGLVVGGLIGAGIGAASGSNTGFLGGSSRGIGALVGVAIGAPSGAVVGACVPAHTTIYRANPAAISH